MVGFRNSAAHDYQKLNLEIVRSILEGNLSDFRRSVTCLSCHRNVELRTSNVLNLSLNRELRTSNHLQALSPRAEINSHTSLQFVRPLSF